MCLTQFQTNVKAVEAAGAAGVPRVVLLGATCPAWAPEGYVKGKEMGEAAAQAFVSVDAKVKTGRRARVAVRMVRVVAAVAARARRGRRWCSSRA